MTAEPTVLVAPRRGRSTLAVLAGLVAIIVLATVGAVASISAGNMGPTWYPIALVVSALPCAWLGGRLHRGAGV